MCTAENDDSECQTNYILTLLLVLWLLLLLLLLKRKEVTPQLRLWNANLILQIQSEETDVFQIEAHPP